MLIAIASAGCAPAQPVLYPNPHLQSVGQDAALADRAACIQLADESVDSSAAAEATRETARGAAVGGATAAAAGAVLGGPGAAAGAGAAGGATHGLLHWLFRPKPDRITRSFVERCLHEQGYDVIGWR